MEEFCGNLADMSREKESAEECFEKPQICILENTSKKNLSKDSEVVG